MSKNEEPLSFEDALAKLENIIEHIDDENQPLEDSVKLYEEGISLANHCTQTLEEAELRIEEVSKKQES
ncbi:MAG TPA: exodeoxyribonuclease VII small subunit [Balneolaceae bacterium]|nr:exodeoxyribonuclease VII small subunit [Balneolaceae bacterium]